jgi:hypothetical protein
MDLIPSLGAAPGAVPGVVPGVVPVTFKLTAQHAVRAESNRTFERKGPALWWGKWSGRTFEADLGGADFVELSTEVVHRLLITLLRSVVGTPFAVGRIAPRSPLGKLTA